MRSLALLGDEIAHRAIGRDLAPSGPHALAASGGCHQSFSDETVQRAWLVQWHESCDSGSMVSDRHLVAVSDDVKVSTEVVS
jgi:hypothetical protein